METDNLYKSFINEKAIEELQYNMLQYKTRLLYVKVEQDFYNMLINAPIFKPRVINLYERLEQFRRGIKQTEILVSALLIEVNSHINKISSKMESEDLVGDGFFLKEHEELEHRIYDFLMKSIESKSQLFQYIQSVLLC